ncbi:MAG: hypothetical protein FWE22_06925 [Firmicutes bacterium]|nr:hypothetical protein [Bacillota bacterium]
MNLIKRQQVPNREVEMTNGNFYGIGWNISEDGNTIRHAGGNPHFVTELIFLPQENKAVAVLMNSATGSPGNLARNILNILEGNSINISPSSELVLFDTMSSVLSIVLIIAITALLGLIILKIFFVKKGLSRRTKPKTKQWIFIGIAALLTILFLIITFLIPSIFGYATWAMTIIWAPSTIPVVFALLCAFGFVLTSFAILHSLFKKDNK